MGWLACECPPLMVAWYRCEVGSAIVVRVLLAFATVSYLSATSAAASAADAEAAVASTAYTEAAVAAAAEPQMAIATATYAAADVVSAAVVASSSWGRLVVERAGLVGERW